MWWLLMLACGGSPDDKGGTGDTVVDTAVVTAEVVVLETRDGVSLEADYYAADSGEVGVVLLHMIPPNWNRTSWPSEFVTRFQKRGWQVLAIDRRGAGNSGGVAIEAYEGEKGRYDVEAAAAYLREQGAEKMVLIGASNGTTSALDFALWSVSEEALKTPDALVMMTGGTYTENNNDFGALALGSVMFTYSTEERAWSVAQQEHDPGSWLFREVAEGAHGTLMFEAEPSVSEEIETFLATVLGTP